ncbi:hypothetical protein PVMG_04430 [Plasmodium vivax Mauritania I]|uniref:Uncharacterized protein n=1 Tax=Plasmodium vivax Mauritania I TaxID=1035515 RepID=A0A0J9TA40_PLAVI|nr:hypothetical protein PVMG_04430 [Plasmodium vivax Mauritania I]
MTSCITPSKTDSEKILNEFSVGCGSTVFKPFLHEFDRVNKEYLDYIKGIKDPILRHISLYFVQYYIDGYYYYRYSQNSQKDGACDYLKRWLQERKDLFTYGEKCPTKMTLWKDKVEPLWEKLEKDYSIQNHGVNSWCNNKYPLFLQTEYPQGLTPFNCDERISQETSKANCPSPPVQAPCSCPPCKTSVFFPQTYQPPQTDELQQIDQLQQTDRTKNLAVTSGFTAVGTLVTLFFLYRVINKQ